MPSQYKSRILRHVSHRDYEPRQVRELAKALGVPTEEHADFREALDELVGNNQVVLGAADAVALPPIGREVTGRFKRHERGFGFIIPDQRSSHGDVFVSPRDTGGAMTGDRVRADIAHRDRGKHGTIAGVVTEIIQRNNTQVVGTLDQRGKQWIVHPDGKAVAGPVLVRDAKAKNAKVGNKVVLELTVFPERRGQTAEGVIVETLGEAGAPDVETMGVIRAYGLHTEFPEAVVNEARAATRDYNDHQSAYFEDRLDLRDTFTLTIDPPDAKDFDDAISLSRTDAGWELGVHIADVATFVRPGGELDAEAYERGNSSYLPRLVLPMLPEVLSNGICSLQPAVPRLAKSCFITYDREGRPIGTRIANAVIESNHRLTYLEAQALIDGDERAAKKHQVYELPYSDPLAPTLKALDQLARTILKRREADGMISLDLPEVELVFDEDGRVIDARPEDDAFTHRIVEMFMVEANEAIARLFNDLDVPLIRRVHPDPEAHDTDELRRFARVAGYNIPRNPSRKELQGLLHATRGKPAAKAVHLAVLKTLTKAEYSPALVGHFALASQHYTHFTSPIRRYPDLLVHRAIEALLEAMGQESKLPAKKGPRKQLANKLSSDERCADEDKLAEMGRHCSATERNSEQAERELRDFLVLQLLQDHVGDIFPGTVTGVTGFGIFVQIDKYLVEGLIKTTDLPGAPADQWKLNEQTGSMTSQRSGRAITIGDTFEVQIVSIDLARREMDLKIVEKRSDKKSQKHKPRRDDKPKPRKSRGSGQRKAEGPRGRRE